LESAAVAREDYGTAYSRAQKIKEAGRAEARDLNALAWYGLFLGKGSEADLEDAAKAAQLSQNSTSTARAGILHTLGCLYAELGKTKEAREVLVQAMDLVNLDEPDPNYWYAFGRIAEQYGENQVAAADYARVTQPKQAIQIPGSSYRLAQMRLKAMPGK
jgi:tetratricopeptide (TPR) repeat protein